MALTVSNIRAGARRIYWDTPGSEVELGLTMPESVFRVTQGGEELFSEQFGIAPVDYVYNGMAVSFVGLFREWGAAGSNAILEILAPGSTSSTGPTVKAWQFGETAGVLASSIAKQLRLHPAKIATQSDDSDDLIIHLAVPVMAAEVGLTNRGNAGVWAVSFLGLVDTSQSEGAYLGRWKTDAS